MALYKSSPLNVLLIKKAPDPLRTSAINAIPKKSSPEQINGASML